MIRRPGALVSGALLLLVALWALVPRLFSAQDPIRGTTALRLRAPSFEHPFGTDPLGRDLLARVIHGAGTSLGAVLLAVAVAFVAGTAIGLASGFVGGRVDEVVMRTVDVLISIPSLLIAIIIITGLGFGMVNVAVAVGVASVAAFSRVMRAEVLRVRSATFVEAAWAIGVRWPSILWRHVLPHALGPMVVLATLEFGVAVLSVSALSFLGFGATPPTPEWGALIAEGRRYLATAWWLCVLPGAVVVAVVLAANHLGRTGLRTPDGR